MIEQRLQAAQVVRLDGHGAHAQRRQILHHFAFALAQDQPGEALAEFVGIARAQHGDAVLADLEFAVPGEEAVIAGDIGPALAAFEQVRHQCAEPAVQLAYMVGCGRP
ncbi:hypothetical protein D3C80_1797820 [compost metagenome]